MTRTHVQNSQRRRSHDRCRAASVTRLPRPRRWAATLSGAGRSVHLQDGYLLGLIIPAFPKALWICRCAWTTRSRRHTTPQGPHQQVIDIKKRKKSSARAECDEATSRVGEAMFDGSGTFSGAAIRPLTLIVARREALAIAQRLVDNAFHGRAVVPPESGRLLAPYISFLGLHLARTRSAPASRRMSILSSAAKPSSRGAGLWRRSSPCRGSAGAPC